jgi:hypothetical protein
MRYQSLQKTAAKAALLPLGSDIQVSQDWVVAETVPRNRSPSEIPANREIYREYRRNWPPQNGRLAENAYE